MTEQWDAIVVGGGVAGLSAAQMLGRSRRRTLVIDGGEPRNRFAARMHGVLGQDGTDPAALLATGRAELGRYDVRIDRGAVVALEDRGDAILVRRDDGTEDLARVVVLASGVRDALPELPGLAEGWGTTVLHCPYCHGWEVAGRTLGVLALSPMSLHQIELVRQLSEDVTAFTALAGMLDEATAARFTARGIRVVPTPVVAIDHRSDGRLGIRTDDGDEHVVDAAFTGAPPAVDLPFASALDLARADGPGSPLAVDPMGRTSHARVFAAGNVVAPHGNVPVSMASGSMAGAGANAALVAEDGDRAVAARTALRHAGWEERYAAEGRFWSGRVNATVARLVEPLAPGSALDIGSGEGGDVVWLAEHGWRATGVDVSPTAVRRATALAEERGAAVELRVGDGAASVEGEFDLVLASFLHSWQEDFPRIRMLRDAAERVSPGGRLLVVSHAAPPPWARELPAHLPVMRGPEEELALLALDPDRWIAERVEVQQRDVTAPDGSPARLDDGVLLLRRTR